jgi:hypothetical protein
MSLPLPLRHQLLRLLSDVSQATGIKSATILGRSRHQPVADARFLFVHVAAHHAATREQIAEFLRRDRTSIDHALRVVAALIETQPDSNMATLVEALSQDATSQIPSVPQIHHHLHQPTTPMITKRAPADHKLRIDLIADAAREISSVLEKFSQAPGVTDLETLVLLRETAAHCMSHYTDVRCYRRREGHEPDPYNDCKGLEAWISLAENAADPPAPQRLHPARNPRPATAAPAA